jgi:hypothetical protein
MAKGHIARPLFFLGCFSQTRGMVVTFQIFVGPLVQKGNFNSVAHLLNLVNSLEIVENSANCKLDFARFLVRSTTSFVILT